MENTRQAHLDSICADIERRQKDGILEKADAELLIRLIKQNPNDADQIASLGTMLHKTGLVFQQQSEKPTKAISYLERDNQLSFGDGAETANRLIIGDNYPALQNLLIQYHGQIDVIYIDPPYGKDSMGEYAKTNYENAISRDNLLSSLMPRLVLAKELLSDEGVIYCSIDDRNQAYIKCLLDEVFGEHNFIENFIWIKNATKNLSNTTSTNHEYVICYVKNKHIVENLGYFRVKKQGYNEVMVLLGKADSENWSVQKTESALKELYMKHPDWKAITGYDHVEKRADASGQMRLRAYTLDNASAPKSSGSGPKYDVIHPAHGVPCKCPSTGWRFTRDTMQKNIEQGLMYFYDTADKVPRFKRFLDTVSTEVQKSYIQDFTDGKKELQAVFDTNEVFDNAKPTTLIKALIKLIPKKDIIVLDFFAGSGTTGQAVLDLNREDGGNRTFILCTNEDKGENGEFPNGIAKDVTYERLYRVMNGKGTSGQSFPWAEKNQPYGGSLEVDRIKQVSAFNYIAGQSPADVIDETRYGVKKFDNVTDKAQWIGRNFRNATLQLEGGVSDAG